MAIASVGCDILAQILLALESRDKKSFRSTCSQIYSVPALPDATLVIRTAGGTGFGFGHRFGAPPCWAAQVRTMSACVAVLTVQLMEAAPPVACLALCRHCLPHSLDCTRTRLASVVKCVRGLMPTVTEIVIHKPLAVSSAELNALGPPDQQSSPDGLWAMREEHPRIFWWDNTFRFALTQKDARPWQTPALLARFFANKHCQRVTVAVEEGCWGLPYLTSAFQTECDIPVQYDIVDMQYSEMELMMARASSATTTSQPSNTISFYDPDHIPLAAVALPRIRTLKCVIAGNFNTFEFRSYRVIKNIIHVLLSAVGQAPGSLELEFEPDSPAAFDSLNSIAECWSVWRRDFPVIGVVRLRVVAGHVHPDSLNHGHLLCDRFLDSVAECVSPLAQKELVFW